MKILHIYKDYYPVIGGIENSIKLLAESQAKEGHAVTVLTASPNHRTVYGNQNGVTFLKLRRWATVASTPITPTLPFAIQSYYPDITHLHSPYPPGELFNAILGKGRFTVITHHSDIVRQKRLLIIYAPLLKWVLRKADRIIATSENYIDSSPFLTAHKKKCRIVPLGIDIGRFAPAPCRLLEKLKKKFASPLILFVGRLRYYKGIDILLQAMALVPNAQLLIVGDGPQKKYLQRLTLQLKLDGRVYFTGEVSDDALPSYYQAADCFVLPSNCRAEAFGIVLLEAMASGLPLISTNIGTGTSKINIHGRTGLVVEPNSPTALSAAIETIINNSSLQSQFSEYGRKQVRKYSRAIMSRKVMAVYRELISSGT